MIKLYEAVKCYKQAVDDLNGIADAEKAMFQSLEDLEARRELELAMLELANNIRALCNTIDETLPSPRYCSPDQLSIWDETNRLWLLAANIDLHFINIPF